MLQTEGTWLYSDQTKPLLATWYRRNSKEPNNLGKGGKKAPNVDCAAYAPQHHGMFDRQCSDKNIFVCQKGMRMDLLFFIILLITCIIN